MLRMAEVPPLPGDALFDERNAFLDLLLGMLSISERAVATITDLAPASETIATAAERLPPVNGPLLR